MCSAFAVKKEWQSPGLHGADGKEISEPIISD
jgi:hypothetical protein